jgi:hypothetical protein
MKRMLLQFIGGYWDGKTLDTASSDPTETWLAGAYYWLTNEATVGTTFQGLSRATRDFFEKHSWRFPKEMGRTGTHVFRVTERIEEHGQIVVKSESSPRTGGSQASAASAEAAFQVAPTVSPFLQQSFP